MKQDTSTKPCNKILHYSMGRTKLIETPDKLYKIFEEYRQETKANPRKKTIKGNKDWIISDEELEVPLTMAGFEVFCYKNYSTVNQYFDNADKRYNDYITICSIIRNEIRQDQIEGGMVGQYNSSITQRLNNLSENVKTNNNHNVNLLNIDPLDDSTDNSTKKDS